MNSTTLFMILILPWVVLPTQTRLIHKFRNQYQACLYLFECISHGDSKYNHQIQICLIFFIFMCVTFLTCRLLTSVAWKVSNNTYLISGVAHCSTYWLCDTTLYVGAHFNIGVTRFSYPVENNKSLNEITLNWDERVYNVEEDNVHSLWYNGIIPYNNSK